MRACIDDDVVPGLAGARQIVLDESEGLAQPTLDADADVGWSDVPADAQAQAMAPQAVGSGLQDELGIALSRTCGEDGVKLAFVREPMPGSEVKRGHMEV